MPRTRRVLQLTTLGAALVLIAASAAVLMRSLPPQVESLSVRHASEPGAERARVRPLQVAAPVPARARLESIDEPALDAAHEENALRAVPHPASDERHALMPPWGTFGEVLEALDSGDSKRARAIVKERRSRDARRAQWVDFYDGLELIADCLESPSAQTQARAGAFIAEYRASPLRRHVRRKCQVRGAARGALNQ